MTRLPIRTLGVVLLLTATGCANAPIKSPSAPGYPCGMNGDSCGNRKCCDRPYVCAPGKCRYGGGGNSGEYFQTRPDKPQRDEGSL